MLDPHVTGQSLLSVDISWSQMILFSSRDIFASNRLRHLQSQVTWIQPKIEIIQNWSKKKTKTGPFVVYPTLKI